MDTCIATLLILLPQLSHRQLVEVSVIEPPASAKQITNESCHTLLSSAINPNAALCTAFTEPHQGVHKSVLLCGVKLAAPFLSGDDLRIRQPRLNRQSKIFANIKGDDILIVSPRLLGIYFGDLGSELGVVGPMGARSIVNARYVTNIILWPSIGS